MKNLFLLIVITIVALQDSAHAQALDKDVSNVLTRMSEFIEGAKTYSMVVDTGYEVLQADGRRLEFGSTITASLQRPSRANVHFENRNGENTTIVLDGDTVSVFSTRGSAEVYDITRQPGDIDASFVYLSEQLGTPDQLHHFFAIDLTDSMKRMVESGYYVGEATIAGVLCDNLALRNENEDVQLWVTKGEAPVPRRIVVTYRKIEGQPQFRAQFSEWNFSPDLPESGFSYSPPAQAKRVSFFR